MYYVYILESHDDRSWYTGYSSNLQRRYREHLSGQGCKTTSKHSGWTLIYYEAYVMKQDAIGREEFLKSGSGKRFLKKQLLHYLSKRPK